MSSPALNNKNILCGTLLLLQILLLLLLGTEASVPVSSANTNTNTDTRTSSLSVIDSEVAFAETTEAKSNTINIIPFEEGEEPTHDAQTTGTSSPSASASASTSTTNGNLSLPTNFKENVPFNFTHIFFFAGNCSAPDLWYGKWSQAGLKTLEAYVTERICAEEGDGDQYSRSYQLNALKRVEEKAGNQLNETLVITLGMGLENDWEPVARLLRKGMAFFHGGYTQDDSLAINLTQYGLTATDVLYLYFKLDEEEAAISAGREVCRLKGGRRNINVAKLYPSNRRDLDFRVDLALAEFQQECSSTLVDVVWDLRSPGTLQDSRKDYTTALRFNHLPDIIFCTQDSLAEDILTVAREFLPPDEASRIETTGWDNDRPSLVDEKKILTSVDQMVHHVGRGLWDKVNTILDIVQQTGQNSTRALQQVLKLDDKLMVHSDTLLISSDKVGYILDTLLHNGYDPVVAPKVNLNVSTGIHDTSITQMTPFDGLFQAVLWLQSSWYDSRLSWNPFIYNGTLEISHEQIWIPQLSFLNQFSSEVLSVSLATITAAGWVTLKMNYNSEFLCPTSDDLVDFPFDRYKCSIDLGAPNGVWLDQNHGFNVTKSDPYFDTTWSWEKDHFQNNTVSYKLRFNRRHFTAYVRLVLPALLINAIGFISFWIDHMEASMGLGITGFLCALAFRDTVEVPETASVTWSEVFILVNLWYQGMVMLVIWLSYGHTLGHITRRVNKYCEWFPRQAAKRITDRMKQKAARAASRTSNALGFKRDIEKLRQQQANIPANDEENAGAAEEVAPVENNPSTKEMAELEEDNQQDAVSEHSDSAGEPYYENMPLRQRSSANVEIGELNMKIERTKYGEFKVADLDVSAQNQFDMSARKENYKKNDDVLRIVVHQQPQAGPENLDWIGRWIVVPSYIIVFLSLLYGGWGFFDYD